MPKKADEAERIDDIARSFIEHGYEANLWKKFVFSYLLSFIMILTSAFVMFWVLDPRLIYIGLDYVYDWG
jgi:hypothetical protein